MLIPECYGILSKLYSIVGWIGRLPAFSFITSHHATEHSSCDQLKHCITCEWMVDFLYLFVCT